MNGSGAAMNVLGELLRIKEFREEKAELESARALAALDEATRKLEHTRQTREEYRDWWRRREAQLYAELCSRQVRLRDIDDVSLQVDLMRERMREHDQAVTEAEEHRKSAFERRTQAREAHREATRKREKFTELGQLVQADALIEQARAEDLEMEEVPRQPTDAEQADEAWSLEAQP